MTESADFSELVSLARQGRWHVIRTVSASGAGHVGGPMSAMDLLIALYFRVMAVRPNEPQWPDRDRFILSKGHSAIGLYAVMSYSVSQGTREFGLRIALGAGVRDLLQLVLSHGLRLTVAGIVIGAIAALLLTRLMGNLLYKVNPRDPIAFGAALIVLIGVALVACFLPARRATRIDPVQALREQ